MADNKCFFCDKDDAKYLLENKVKAKVFSCKKHRDIALSVGWIDITDKDNKLKKLFSWLFSN